ncbi:MAG: hypothetical protein E7263_11690 [Lachnospiraceae bacterium]|nr:hypothetical protein [Lachnospiraceae bacterium]
MKKKCLLIFVGIILALVAAGAILLPKRIELYDAINDNIETLGTEGKMFDAYDVTDDSLVQVETDYLTMGVPQDCSLGDSQIVYDYTNDDESVYVGISQSVREEKIAFFNSGYTDKSKIFDIVYSLDDLRDGFEKLGYGIPDSTYNTYKCFYLLKEEDYSFWDYEKALAFANTAFVKNEVAQMDVHYVYERDDMYALIMERNMTEEGKIYFYVDVFSPDDLNKSCLVLIRVEDRQQAYAMINSIKVK